MFEHRSEDVLPGHRFALRLLRHLFIAAGIVVVSLVVGIVGYEHFEHLGFRDAFLNAAMLLGGMGPVDVNLSPAERCSPVPLRCMRASCSWWPPACCSLQSSTESSTACTATSTERR